MVKIDFFIKVPLLSYLLFTPIFASNFSVNPSFQGYTGVINTPNAQVLKEGHASLHVNNQFDSFLKNTKNTKKTPSQVDYVVGFGLFSFMEVQGRLSESKGYHRDLSANFKIQLPYHHKYLPDLAVGIQDLGGAANSYDNKYLVLDKEFMFIRASLGYGNSGVKRFKNKRMDGTFGALEIKARDYLYLLAENDSVQNHIAMRFEMPKTWMSGYNIRTTIAHNITDNTNSMGINIDIELYHKSSKLARYYQKNKSKIIDNLYKEKKSKKLDAKIKTIISKNENVIKSIQSLQKHLGDFGFENISIGTNSQHIYIKFENSIFDYTDLDALGYVLGVLASSELQYDIYSITLLKNNIRTLSMSGKTSIFRKYLKNNSMHNEQVLKNDLRFERSLKDSNIKYGKKLRSSFFIPRVKLSLGLTTAVGTEFGVLDYIAALRTNVYMNIYDGLIISTMYESPFANSNDFNKGEVYYNETKMQNRFVSAMLHQTIHFRNILNTTSIGKYKTDFFGVLNQTNYTSTSGRHAVKFRSGYFTNTNNTSLTNKEIFLSSYRYNYAPMDLYVEATYGKYWYGDTGAEIEFKRFFGETSLSFYYKNTSIIYSNKTRAKEQFAGMKVSFPLSIRKLYRAKYIQFKGDKNWDYSLSSTLNREDGTNSLNYNFGITPLSNFEITSEYLNRDRLGSAYILHHLDRLREAYLEYKP